MYKPAPQRPRKTAIVRSRTGCATCRQQRRKCDEARPQCVRCTSRNLPCGGYGTTFRFLDATASTEQSVSKKIARSKLSYRRADTGGLPMSELSGRTESEDGEAFALNEKAGTNGENSGESRRNASHQHRDEDDDNIEIYSPDEPRLDCSNSPTLTENQATGYASPESKVSEYQESSWEAYIPSYPTNMHNSPRNLLNRPRTSDSSFEITELDSLPSRGPMFTPSEMLHQEPSPSHTMAEYGSETLGSEFPTRRDSSRSWDTQSRYTTGVRTTAASTPSQPSQNFTEGQLDVSDPVTVRKLDCSERMYIAHFMTHMVRILPEGIFHYTSSNNIPVPLQHAIIALAAANLAYLEGESDVVQNPAGPKPLALKPSHMIQATTHFTIVAKDIRKLTLPLETLITTIFLLAYFELEAGTIQGFFHHTSGLDSLIMERVGKLAGISHGQQLLQAWALLHARVSIYRFPFCLDAEDSQGIILNTLAHRFASTLGKLSLIFSETFLITTRLLLMSCMRLGYEDERTTLEKSIAWYQSMRGPSAISNIRQPENYLAVSELYKLLAQLREQLNMLPPARHSIYSTEMLAKFQEEASGQNQSRTDQGKERGPHQKLRLVPISMDSHEEAMDHALFAAANLLCDEEVLTNMLDPEGGVPNPPLSRWMFILLSIADGLDPMACICKNSYVIGITCILMAAASRCPNLMVLDYLIDTFLPRLRATGRLREDSSISLELCKASLELQRSELERGRLIFCAVVDVNEHEERQNLANLARPLCFTVHGRFRRGAFFNDCVVLP